MSQLQEQAKGRRRMLGKSIKNPVVRNISVAATAVK